MQTKIDLLKQCITELETEKAELKAELEAKNSEIPKLKKKLAEVEARNVEIEARNVELMKQMIEENNRRDARIEKLEEKQLQNDNTPNNILSNFNSGAVHHEKPLEEKEMDNFLLEAHKKIVSSKIKQRNKEKKLSKAEQASLNQDQESETGCSTSEKMPEVSNPVTKISAGQNSHRKKGAENIVQLIADGIKDDAQSSDKAIPCDVISIENLNQIHLQIHCFL